MVFPGRRFCDHLGLDHLLIVNNLAHVKANPKFKATKRTPARKVGKRLTGKKSLSRGGFAPELRGVVTSPTELSLREGFGRG